MFMVDYSISIHGEKKTKQNETTHSCEESLWTKQLNIC